MPNNREFGHRTKNSSPATTPQGAKSLANQSNDYPGVSGVTLANGLRYLTAIENAVMSELPRVPIEGNHRQICINCYLAGIYSFNRSMRRFLFAQEKKGGAL